MNQEAINSEQIKEIEKVASQKGNIFEDLNSPFKTVHQKVKLLLTSCSKDSIPDYTNLNFSLLGYQPKKTRNNFCTHIIKKNEEEWIQCESCRSQEHLIYCASCFEVDKHIGHQFRKKLSTDDFAYCDCGRIDRLKQTSFCQKHAEYDKIIVCQITQEQQNQFVEIFCGLLDCSIYEKQRGQKNVVLIIKIINFLVQLNQSSVYYNRLTFRVLISKSKYWNSIENQNQQKEDPTLMNQYFLFLYNKTQMDQLFLHMFGDLQTRIDFIRQLDLMQKQHNRNKMGEIFTTVILKQLTNHTTMSILSQFDIHSKLVNKFFLLNSSQTSQKCKKIYQYCYQNQIRLASDLFDAIDLIQVKLTDFPAEIKKKLVIKLLQLYPSRAAIHRLLKEEGNLDAEFPLFYSTKYPIKLKTLNDVILRMMVESEIGADIQILKNLRQFFFQNGVSQQNLQSFTYFMNPQLCHSIYFIKKEQIGKNYPLYIIYFICLIKGSLDQKLLIQTMWGILLQSHNPQVTDSKKKKCEFTQLVLFVDIFHFIVSCIVHSDLLLMLRKKSYILPEKDQIIQKKIDEWFRSYLYEMKAITKEELLSMKQRNITTDNFIKIVNQLCIYSYEYSTFVYFSDKKYPNIANQLYYMPTKGNIKNLYNSQIRLQGKLILQKDSLANYLFEIAIKNTYIIKFIDWQYIKYQKSLCFNDNQYFYTYLYIFSEVLFDILIDGSNQELRGRLIKLGESMKKRFQDGRDSGQEGQLLRRLLNIDKQNLENVQVNQKINEQPQNMQIGQKSENEADTKQKPKQIEIKQNICVSCKNQGTVQAPLAYILGINKDHTFSSMFYGSNNVSRTYLETCLHPIHIHCFSILRFAEMKRRIRCPLCEKLSNCLIPTSYQKDNEQFNQACQNTMIHSSIQSALLYDIDNIFILIFKHFVESYGLRAFTPKSYTLSTPAVVNSNKFLLNYAQEIYFTSSEEQKNDYLEEIEMFTEKVKKTSDRMFELIQLLIVGFVKGMIINKKTEIDYQILQELVTMLSKEQYEALKANLTMFSTDKIIFDGMQQKKQKKDADKKEVESKLLLKFIQLPQYPLILFEISNILNCRCEIKRRANGMCLFCGAGICSNCSQKHKQNHNNIQFYFVFSNFMVYTNLTQYSSICWHVYESEFKVPINDGAKDLKNFDESAYTLSKSIYQFIIDQYLENN